MLTVFYIGGNISRYIMNLIYHDLLKFFLIQLSLHVFITDTLKYCPTLHQYDIYMTLQSLLNIPQPSGKLVRWVMDWMYKSFTQLESIMSDTYSLTSPVIAVRRGG